MKTQEGRRFHPKGDGKLISTNVYLFPIEKVVDFDRDFFENHFPKRLKRAEAFAFEKDKQRCLGVAVVLKTVLGISECDIKYGKYGKPYSDKTSKQFSISHSGEFVVLAISDEEIGVDIQENNIKFTDSVYRLLTNNEKKYLDEHTGKEFFKIWSLKESLSKAVGKGLAVSFAQIDTAPFLVGKHVDYGGEKYFAGVVEIDNYYITICTKNIQSLSHIEKM